MKIRIGLITEDKTAQDQLKTQFEDIRIYPSTNVMEFYQLIGNNKIEAIVFSGGQKMAQEFSSYHAYLRQKPQFKTIPMAVLTSVPLINKTPMPDPFVRSYSLEHGYFLTLMGFFSAVQDNSALTKILESQQIEELFSAALSSKVGSGNVFTARAATPDEGHSEFLVQQTDEVASNLLWMKFSVRLLSEGSEQLMLPLKDLPEDEQFQFNMQILTSVFDDFTLAMHNSLASEGALFFNKTEHLPATEKTPYIKKAKSQSVVFASPHAQFLVEFIRYL